MGHEAGRKGRRRGALFRSLLVACWIARHRSPGWLWPFAQSPGFLPARPAEQRAGPLGQTSVRVRSARLTCESPQSVGDLLGMTRGVLLAQAALGFSEGRAVRRHLQHQRDAARARRPTDWTELDVYSVCKPGAIMTESWSVSSWIISSVSVHVGRGTRIYVLRC